MPANAASMPAFSPQGTLACGASSTSAAITTQNTPKTRCVTSFSALSSLCLVVAVVFSRRSGRGQKVARLPAEIGTLLGRHFFVGKLGQIALLEEHSEKILLLGRQ